MWAITVSVLAIIFVLWILWRQSTFSELSRLGIPGPAPNLLFGNLLEIFKKSPLECHKEWTKKYGRVVGYYFGTMPMVLISDLELLKKIQVGDFHKFINRPPISPSLKDADKKRVEGFSQQLTILRDKRWKEVRSILTPSFTTAKMRQMGPIMNSAIDTFMQNVDKTNGLPFDIYPMFQGLTMDVIGRTAFGIQTNVQNDPNDPFLRTTRGLISGGDMRSPLLILAGSFQHLGYLWFWLYRLNKMFRKQAINPLGELLVSVKEVISTRRKSKENRRPDLLQLMIDAEISESDMAALTTEDLTAKDQDSEKKQSTSTTTGKLTPGYETTSTALAFTVHLLVHHQDVQDKVRKEVQQLLREKDEVDYSSVQELQYLDQVFNESLRMYPPVYLFVNREAGEDVNFGSFRLKKGTAVQVPVYLLHRDPELWEDPDVFRPERFAPENRKHQPLAFQPFGAGPRNCVGMRFAQLQAKIVLARLLSRYRLEKCPQTDKVDITLRTALASIKPLNGVYLKATPIS